MSFCKISFFVECCRANFVLQNCILPTLNVVVLVTSMIDFRRFTSFCDLVGYQRIEYYYSNTYRTHMKFYQKLRYVSLYHMAKFHPQIWLGPYPKFYDTRLDLTISHIVCIVYRPLFHRNSFSF